MIPTLSFPSHPSPSLSPLLSPHHTLTNPYPSRIFSLGRPSSAYDALEPPLEPLDAAADARADGRRGAYEDERYEEGYEDERYEDGYDEHAEEYEREERLYADLEAAL